jgi:hypothetical protein
LLTNYSSDQHRSAFGERYAALASDLAEKMGRFRQKEAAFRDTFRRHVADLIPLDLLDAMGLLQQPPHCQVNVPGDESSRLMPVSPDDLRRLQLPWSSGSIETSLAAVSRAGAATAPTPSSEAVEGQSEAAVAAALRMENARLRAELSSQVALDCIRAAEMAALGPLSSLAPFSPNTDGKEEKGEKDAAAAKFEKALSAKDTLIVALQDRAAASQAQAAGYERRVRELEARLTEQARSQVLQDVPPSELPSFPPVTVSPALSGSGYGGAHVAPGGSTPTVNSSTGGGDGVAREGAPSVAPGSVPLVLDGSGLDALGLEEGARGDGI